MFRLSGRVDSDRDARIRPPCGSFIEHYADIWRSSRSGNRFSIYALITVLEWKASLHTSGTFRQRVILFGLENSLCPLLYFSASTRSSRFGPELSKFTISSKKSSSAIFLWLKFFFFAFSCSGSRSRGSRIISNDLQHFSMPNSPSFVDSARLETFSYDYGQSKRKNMNYPVR